MIKYFKWKNAFSYPSEGEIDFTVNIKDTSNESSYVTYQDCKVSKLAVIVGHNCSGKTNVIKILHFISWFMANSFHDGLRNIPSYIHPRNIPFMKYDGESTFETCFIIDNEVYTYNVRVKIKTVKAKHEVQDAEFTILSEELTKKTQLGTTEKIFSRDRQGTTFNRKDDALYNELSCKIVRTDASVIAALSISNHEEMRKIQDFWSKVMVAHKIFYESSIPNKDYYLISEILKKQHSENILKRLKYELSKLDIGKHELRFDKVYDNLEQKIVWDMYMDRIHKDTTRTPFWLRPGYESNGLVSLFFKLYDILFNINNKNPMLAIDEIEESLHYEAILRIIKLFCDKENKQTQLLCTTHMSPVLSRLEPPQVHMVDKNDDNESEIYRLDQVEGVTSDDDIYENYMSGLYGAFPNIFN